MTRDRYQLGHSAARIYEEQKVRAIFGPLARATLKAVSLRPGDRILDVACGTGIVARTIRDLYGTDVEITGSDLNAGMIEMARGITSDLDPPIEWVVADAADLPFDDGTFTVCMCQQGIQFIPDKRGALLEFRRVLSPGGLLAISVWDGASAFFMAMAEALRRHVGEAAAEQSLAPFTYRAAEDLPRLLATTGFRDVAVQAISIDRIIDNPQVDIPKEIIANPVGSSVTAKGEEAMRTIVREIIADCEEYRVGDTLAVPQTASVITASTAQ
ncbi:methyltransferase domain-containing protein [Defluviimonas sp. WL0002]|uniref:Methyltransferase domain-containing protein n=1 Tax=Albidovulum marisflavi TaxID=2984159 RepID=A0ABT2ZGP6_9RHOB|nr:methyltransferase domain-containing protein [Defluviimonas sp. WL0002]MCV2870328.1 methyltransferase domain-containing protein [Defluviimonas sp. WL0002]